MPGSVKMGGGGGVPDPMDSIWISLCNDNVDNVAGAGDSRILRVQQVHERLHVVRTQCRPVSGHIPSTRSLQTDPCRGRYLSVHLARMSRR